MNLKNLKNLEKETELFFSLHWPSKWNDSPKWTPPWRLEGEMDGGNKQGVYALLNDDYNIIYIGVGASFGGGIYEGFGLGARTGRYTRVAPNQNGVPARNRKYEPSPEWKNSGLAAIAVIRFENEQAYLAYGLEAFLSSRIKTPYNKIQSARVSNS